MTISPDGSGLSVFRDVFASLRLEVSADETDQYFIRYRSISQLLT